MAPAVFRPVLLTLSLLLCSESSEFVKEGETITLSCNNVKKGQRKCDGTTWIFNSAEKTPPETKEIIAHGKIHRAPETLSNRLKVTKNCSLKIQNVQPQDAGVFYCQQYDQSGRRLPPDAAVYLSVVSLTQVEYKEKVQIRCNVSSFFSDVETKWLFNGQNVNDLQLSTTNLRDDIIVTVPKSYVFYKDVGLLKCEVTDGGNKKRFSLRSNKPEKTTTKTATTKTKNGEEDTRETTSEPEPKTEAEDAQTPASPQNTSTGRWLWAVVAAVAGGLVTVAVLIIWRRFRAKPADSRSDPPVSLSAEPEEEGMSYVTISYSKNNQRNEVRRSEEEVTYSSVKNSAVEDPAQLYATVKK